MTVDQTAASDPAPDSGDPSRWILTLSCPDGPGIVHAVAGALAAVGGNITESQQFGDPESGRFFMRVEFAASVDRAVLDAVITPVGARFSMDWRLDVSGRPLRTIVMVSKAPHCLLDLLYRQEQERLPIKVVAVVSNHRDLASAARFHQVRFDHIPVTPATRPAAEARLKDLVTELDVELVVLARYMQILSDDLCDFLAGRAINIHHSFLPSFKGARPYAQAHQRGVKLIGATAHYVTPALDEGPIIEQDVERVDHSITAEGLAHLGEDAERRALARAVRWHAEHRVLTNGARTVVFR